MWDVFSDELSIAMAQTGVCSIDEIKAIRVQDGSFGATS